MSIDVNKMEDLRQVVLEKLKARMTAPFTKEIFDNIRIDQLAEMISRDLWAATLDLLIPAKVVVRPGGSEYVPATWWDHFKMAHGWKHKKRRIVTVEKHYYQCPHISPHATSTDHLEWLYYAGEPEKLRADIERRSEK